MLGEEDEMTERLGLLESFEKSALCRFVHSISGSDDKIAIRGFFIGG